MRLLFGFVISLLEWGLVTVRFCWIVCASICSVGVVGFGGFFGLIGLVEIMVIGCVGINNGLFVMMFNGIGVVIDELFYVVVICF